MKTIVSLLLCLLFFPVEVHSQTVPYVSFMGTNLANHSYMDLTLVGNAVNGSNSVQCHTDLITCCNMTQGVDRGDWYFPNGERLNFYSDFVDVYQVRRPQRVDLSRRNNGDTSGIYRCSVETNMTVVARLYMQDCMPVEVSLYMERVLSIVNRLSTKCTAGDVIIPNGMTFNVDSNLNGESPQFTLTFNSTGGPATTVTWTRDSGTVSGGMTVLDDPVTAQYSHTLTVTGRLGGQYQCTVSNNKPSSANATAQLSVQGSTCSNKLHMLQVISNYIC